MLLMVKSLNDYREDHYMSVSDFAKYLGISVHTFYSITRGDRPTNYSTMRKVAEKLGVHPSAIAEFARPQSEGEDRP